jgi:DNA primase
MVRKRRHTSVAGSPSVVRRAITLVLNHPEAGRTLDLDQLGDVNRPGVDLLAALIEIVQSEPNITTAGLLERWRHDENGRHLGKLAAMDVPSDEDFDAGAELTDCLTQLATAGRKDRITFLIEKQRVESLTDDEISELRQLN